LDLDGILAVTATEKSTGLAKTVRMETTVVDGCGRSVSSISPDDEPDFLEAEEAINQARELRRRAAKLRNIADEADADEIKSLISASREAIAATQWERLTELNESLADLLFYLED